MGDRVEQAQRALDVLLTSHDANLRREADTYLRAVQESDEGWKVGLWCLLESPNTAHRLVGAQMLRQKLSDSAVTPSCSSQLWSALVTLGCQRVDEKDHLAKATLAKGAEMVAQLFVCDPNSSIDPLTAFLRTSDHVIGLQSFEALARLVTRLNEGADEVGYESWGQARSRAHRVVDRIAPIMTSYLSQQLHTELGREVLQLWIELSHGSILSNSAIHEALIRAIDTPGHEGGAILEVLQQVVYHGKAFRSPELLSIGPLQSTAELFGAIEAGGTVEQGLMRSTLKRLEALQRQIAAQWGPKRDSVVKSETLECASVLSKEESPRLQTLATLFLQFLNSPFGIMCAGIPDAISCPSNPATNALRAVKDLLFVSPAVFNIATVNMCDFKETIREAGGSSHFSSDHLKRVCSLLACSVSKSSHE